MSYDVKFTINEQTANIRNLLLYILIFIIGQAWNFSKFASVLLWTTQTQWPSLKYKYLKLNHDSRGNSMKRKTSVNSRQLSTDICLVSTIHFLRSSVQGLNCEGCSHYITGRLPKAL